VSSDNSFYRPMEGGRLSKPRHYSKCAVILLVIVQQLDGTAKLSLHLIKCECKHVTSTNLLLQMEHKSSVNKLTELTTSLLAVQMRLDFVPF